MTTSINPAALHRAALQEKIDKASAEFNRKIYRRNKQRLYELKHYTISDALEMGMYASTEPLFRYGCKKGTAQNLHHFVAWKVDVDGLSRKEAAAARRSCFQLWKAWKANHESYHEDITKSLCDKIRKRKSYLANKERQ